ncbi:Egh16-like virulence factor [Microdochium nivale]|nr:Egh16-like virulence factor [Microdochium nivale]
MKTTTVLSALALFATSVSAHGRLLKPAGLPNSGPLQDIRVATNNCGQGVTVGGNAVASFKAGSTQDITWTVDNGDGAGPLAVSFDPTGKGTAFSVPATMVKQLDGQNGGVPNSFPRGAHVVSFKVPTTKCNKCVMQVRQNLQGGKQGFGSCAVVSIV